MATYWCVRLTIAAAAAAGGPSFLLPVLCVLFRRLWLSVFVLRVCVPVLCVCVPVPCRLPKPELLLAWRVRGDMSGAGLCRGANLVLRVPAQRAGNVLALGHVLRTTLGHHLVRQRHPLRDDRRDLGVHMCIDEMQSSMRCMRGCCAPYLAPSKPGL
eukprot:COSAG01_NODE_1521_length_10036_cov_7.897957_5_plen_157_part_00